MNRRQIALALVLEELGIPATADLFDEHLSLQKIVYLVQSLGVQLGYSYTWDTLGPYSRDLNADGQVLLHSKIPEGWQLDDESKRRLKYANELLTTLSQMPDKDRELEMLASVFFVVNTGQGKDADTITNRLKTAGKPFSREEVLDALRKLSRAEPQGAAG